MYPSKVDNTNAKNPKKPMTKTKTKTKTSEFLVRLSLQLKTT